MSKDKEIGKFNRRLAFTPTGFTLSATGGVISTPGDTVTVWASAKSINSDLVVLEKKLDLDNAYVIYCRYDPSLPVSIDQIITLDGIPLVILGAKQSESGDEGLRGRKRFWRILANSTGVNGSS